MRKTCFLKFHLCSSKGATGSALLGRASLRCVENKRDNVHDADLGPVCDKIPEVAAITAGDALTLVEPSAFGDAKKVILRIDNKASPRFKKSNSRYLQCLDRFAKAEETILAGFDEHANRDTTDLAVALKCAWPNTAKLQKAGEQVDRLTLFPTADEVGLPILRFGKDESAAEKKFAKQRGIHIHRIRTLYDVCLEGSKGSPQLWNCSNMLYLHAEVQQADVQILIKNVVKYGRFKIVKDIEDHLLPKFGDIWTEFDSKKRLTTIQKFLENDTEVMSLEFDFYGHMMRYTAILQILPDLPVVMGKDYYSTCLLVPLVKIIRRLTFNPTADITDQVSQHKIAKDELQGLLTAVAYVQKNLSETQLAQTIVLRILALAEESSTVLDGHKDAIFKFHRQQVDSICDTNNKLLEDKEFAQAYMLTQRPSFENDAELLPILPHCEAHGRARLYIKGFMTARNALKALNVVRKGFGDSELLLSQHEKLTDNSRKYVSLTIAQALVREIPDPTKRGSSLETLSQACDFKQCPQGLSVLVKKHVPNLEVGQSLPPVAV